MTQSPEDKIILMTISVFVQNNIQYLNNNNIQIIFIIVFSKPVYRYPVVWQNIWHILFKTVPIFKRFSKHSTPMDLLSLKAKLENLK